MSTTNVDFTRPEYKAAAPQWELVRAVCRGGEDIKIIFLNLKNKMANAKRSAIKIIKTVRCSIQ